jgi:Putative Ig domain
MAMTLRKRSPYLVGGACLFFLALPALGSAQEAAANREPLAIRGDIPAKLFLHQDYEIHLVAEGGVPPYSWDVSDGSLPPGLVLAADGVLRGVPGASGEFRFTVEVADSGKPAYSRSKDLVLRVTAPLWARWSQPPKVSGRRIEGVIKLSNETDQDFDLTFVVLAVNEIGRATTIGYQRFTLKPETIEMEIPFGENLPRGMYDVNADVVGEVAAANKIYRARLVEQGLRIQQGP